MVGIEPKRSKFPIAIKNIATGALSGYGEQGIKIILAFPEDEEARLKAFQDGKAKECASTFKTMYGRKDSELCPSDLGKPFKLDGRQFTIIGADLRGRDFNRIIIAEDISNKKQYVFEEADVIEAFKKARKSSPSRFTQLRKTAS